MSESVSKSVTLDDDTYARVRLLARAWAVGEGEAVRRLLEHFENEPTADTAAPVDGRVPVHVVYEGNRVDGLYDTATRSLEIVAGPASGRYRSPSGAATAVLQAYNPKVAPNRNGWSFFVVDATGEFLQSIR
ncbi:hypothetical protein [Streptomyces sp. TLI_171]|uniref:hypothetical protein n=1 Tax=Streptomyces sp. TLI_171 TaxID=1938859 RepID=UPI000C496B2A|nr:hypothetical protein [Streptomyces sp. TLI_171]RKE19196.1 hypothetical protein BX266_2511 [Streptomyces sp. TLI_171]